MNGEARVDLDYGEDFDCDVDLNLVFTGDGKLIEVQGTAEGQAFSREQLEALVDVGWQGAQQVVARQREVVGPRMEALGLSLPWGRAPASEESVRKGKPRRRARNFTRRRAEDSWAKSLFRTASCL